MSGEVWLVLVLNGFRVGESVLLRMLKLGSWFSMASPRTSEYCVESQAVLRALKSPRVYVLSRVFMWLRSNWKFGGVEEEGVCRQVLLESL